MQNLITPEATVDENRFRETLQWAQRNGDVQTLCTLFENSKIVPSWAKSNLKGYIIVAYCNAVEQAVCDNDLKETKSILSEWSTDSSLPPPRAQHFNRHITGSLPKAVTIGNRALVRLLISYGARADKCLAKSLAGPVNADDETFDGILQDLLDAGWEFKDSAILADAVVAYMLPSKYDQRLPPWLLKRGANPDLPNGFGTSPMYLVAEYGPLSIIQMLFEYGAKADSNALFAVIRGRKRCEPERIPMMELLLSKGADVNFLHEYERRPTSSALVYARRFRHTPLWEAVKAYKGKDVEMVEFLVKNGADVNLRILVNEVEMSSPLEEMLVSKRVKMKNIGTRLNKGESITNLEGETS